VSGEPEASRPFIPASGAMTTLVVPVPEAEDAVQHWRRRFDWSASLGVPAHITVLGPFLPPSQINGHVRSRLALLCSHWPRVTFELIGVRRRQDVTYLAPEPIEPFEEMTRLLEAEWPDAPRYGSWHGERIYHLTVARELGTFREISRELAEILPIGAVARELVLLEGRTGSGVRELGRFPLDARAHGAPGFCA
jgi:2'-5' RNA ligase superfamily